jgi:hypothetical protein
VSRIKLVREYMPGLFGKAGAWRWRVVRTTNAYVVTDPLASKFDFQTTKPHSFKQTIISVENSARIALRDTAYGPAERNASSKTGT